MLFSFRVALPDRPGALAQLTGLIASRSIDVREVDVLGGKLSEAVDHFLLDGESSHVDALAADLRAGGVFTVLGVRRAGISRDYLPELAVVQAVMKEPDRALALITQAAPRLLDADWSVSFEVGLSYPRARTPSAPEIEWVGRVPMRSSRVVDAGMFTLPEGTRATLATAPIQNCGVVLIGRNDEMPFHDTEILRLQQLMTTIDTILTTTAVLPTTATPITKPTSVAS